MSPWGTLHTHRILKVLSCHVHRETPMLSLRQQMPSVTCLEIGPSGGGAHRYPEADGSNPTATTTTFSSQEGDLGFTWEHRLKDSWDTNLWDQSRRLGWGCGTHGYWKMMNRWFKKNSYNIFNMCIICLLKVYGLVYLITFIEWCSHEHCLRLQRFPFS